MYVYVCIYIYIYVCICMYIYIYIHSYTVHLVVDPAAPELTLSTEDGNIEDQG